MQYRIAAVALLASAVSAQTTAAPAPTGGASEGGDDGLLPNAFRANGDLDISAGKPATAQWINAGDAPCTLILGKGPSTAVQPVSTLSAFASCPSDGTLVWTPKETLENGDDYSYQILSDDGDNRSPPFALTGGSDEAEASGAATTDATATATATSEPTETGATTLETAVSTGEESMPTGGSNDTISSVELGPTATGGSDSETSAPGETQPASETTTGGDAQQTGAANAATKVSFAALLGGLAAAFFAL